jgi:hypothetical protein
MESFVLWSLRVWPARGLNGSENWTWTVAQRRRIEAAEIKLLRSTNNKFLFMNTSKGTQNSWSVQWIHMWILLPCPTAKIHVNLTDINHTTDDNLEGNKETNTDDISYQLFSLLQVKLLKTAN